MKTKQIVLAFCCVMITGTSMSALAANGSTQADEPDGTTQSGGGAAMMQGRGGMMGSGMMSGGMMSQQPGARAGSGKQGHAGRAMAGCSATGLSAMSEGMMGRAMMGNGMMGHHAMSDHMLMPRLPAGNEKLQLQMQAEIMQKVGEIIGKYADEIVVRKGEVQ